MYSSACPQLGKVVQVKNAYFPPTNLFPQSYAAVQMHVLAQRED